MKTISFDVSEITKMISAAEIGDFVQEVVEEVLTEVFIDVTAPPPEGTPVDTGEARNAWQIDLEAGEVYNTAPYINRLNEGHSPQSPEGFIEAAVDKAIDAVTR